MHTAAPGHEYVLSVQMLEKHSACGFSCLGVDTVMMLSMHGAVPRCALLVSCQYSVQVLCCAGLGWWHQDSL